MIWYSTVDRLLTLYCSAGNHGVKKYMLELVVGQIEQLSNKNYSTCWKKM